MQPQRALGLEPFKDKRIIIRCLHGYGDAIQFLRYAGPLRPRARSVTVKRIRRWFHWSGECAVSMPWSPGPTIWLGIAWDQQIEVTELPRAFRSSLATIPRDIPYIHIDESAVAQSRRHLGGRSRPKVGLLWASSNWNPDRCMRLLDLQPLLESRGIDFYSFQRGQERLELLQLAGGQRIHDTAVHSPYIADTAADLINMDLLITVDTMAAHLAALLAGPSGCCFLSKAIGAGWSGAPIRPGIPRCACFVRRPPAIGIR